MTKIFDHQNFTFSTENDQKQLSERGSGEKNAKNSLGRCQQPLCGPFYFLKKSFKDQQRNKNCKTIWGPNEGALIATDVYRATLKKSLEYKK